MKIIEVLTTPKKSNDTISSGTIYSISGEPETQDLVSQDIVPQKDLAIETNGQIEEHPDHSAIAEGVSQIFRRQKGGKPTKGFRCTSGPRKGRIVATPSTCFMKVNPSKGAKIKKKRQMKARQAGKKMAITKRSRPVSRRLKTVQTKKKSSTLPSYGAISSRKPLQKSGGKKMKSRIVKPKK